ncbi:transposase [Cupriavidus basilensis]|uniref:transposase n=1 Tax=Cupriavidus TaxID=106589 RepID=UPI00044DB43C|nr:MULTISPECIES: transposase [Cupriavidus]KDP84739.1 transposase [Cupriavidus sp. SK-3]MDF3886775.1 transposase [Cupriavidus basilensis]
MNRRFSEEQIRGYLAEAATGVPVRELCARYGFSDASFYGWRIKYGQGAGSEVRDSRKMRDLQDENARLKSMLADALLKLELLRNRHGRAGNGKERN